MTLHLFTNVITIGDAMTPIAKGVGSTRVLWLTAKARTNGFTVASNDSALDGFQVGSGSSLDLPISDMVGRISTFSLSDLYWANSVAGDNAVIELIGMRDVTTKVVI
jgi:hypothetical protein